MNRKTENLVLRLRKAGARRVVLHNTGAFEVDFADAPPSPVQTLQENAQQIVDDALAEFREQMDDQREVEDVEEKQRKRRAVERLKYSHS